MLIIKQDTNQIEISPVTYTIQTTRMAKAVDGKEVEVIDDNYTERVTVSELESRKATYQKAIDEIDAKLDTIKSL